MEDAKCLTDFLREMSASEALAHKLIYNVAKLPTNYQVSLPDLRANCLEDRRR